MTPRDLKRLEARHPSAATSKNLVPPDQRRYLLDPSEIRFVEEYLIDLDPRRAAARANLPPDRGRVLLARPKVQEAIALQRRRRLSRLQIYADEIVRRWAALASADPNELVELRRVNCRHCNGVDHEYQFTDLEYRHALSQHRAEMDRLARADADDPRLVPFDEKGGAGFRHNGPPNPDCPACDGDGVPRVILKDTRNLSESARLLYDGVKVGAGGAIEMKFRDRSWAEQQLARHAGLFNERAPIEEFDPNRMSDDQLDATLHSMIERGVVEIEGVATAPADDPDLLQPEPADVADR